MKRDVNVLDIIFPAKCPFCGRLSGPFSEAGADDFCPGCQDEVMRYEKADEIPHEALEKVLRLYVPLRYYGLAKKAMLRYKFGQEQWLYKPFSDMMHRFLTENQGYADIDIITCVPVSKKRYAKRGYDQSRLIARRLSELSGKPYRDLLKRNDRAGAMIATSAENFAERKAEKRFSPVNDELELYGLRVLLVDDIFTTGSTLNECAGILLYHGAMYVNAACMMSGRQDIFDPAAEEIA